MIVTIPMMNVSVIMLPTSMVMSVVVSVMVDMMVMKVSEAVTVPSLARGEDRQEGQHQQQTHLILQT